MVGGSRNTAAHPFDQGVSSGLERCWRRTGARQEVAVVVDVLTARMTVLKKSVERMMFSGSEMAGIIYGVFVFRMCHVCTYVYGIMAL
jgi:hypothetical protein